VDGVASTTLAVIRGGVRTAARRAGRRRVVNVTDAERLASVVTGGALAAFALRRRSLGGAMLGLLGSALVCRGTTGHSTVYEAMGVQGPAAAVPGTVTIRAPVEVIEAVWRDVSGFPHELEEAELRCTPLPAGRGTRVDLTVARASIETVTETLRALKQLAETGEVATTAGQSSGRRRGSRPGRSG
jgi:hypothetical protein